jgi:hypothetical protein
MEASEQPRQKYLFLDHFSLKIIALVLMTLDHVAFFFLTRETLPYEIMRGFGRLAFPLFAFLAIEGVFKSHNALLYGAKLLVLGLLIDLVLFLSVKTYPGNAMVELGLGILAFALLEKKNWLSLLSPLPMAVMVLSDFTFFPIRMEYGTFGLLILAGFYLAKKFTEVYFRSLSKRIGVPPEACYAVNGRLVRNLYSIFALFLVDLLMLLFYLYYPTCFLFANLSLPFALEQYSALAGVFIYFYSGRQGYHNKYVNWGLYAYYPLHFLILYLLFNLI